MLKNLHFSLAMLTVVGLVMRIGWSYLAPQMLALKAVRIAPHLVDTLLLVLGIVLALNLPGGFLQGWLIAKLIALLAYIGFGVMALRGKGAIRLVGITGALLAASYIFLVAFSRQPWPF